MKHTCMRRLFGTIGILAALGAAGTLTSCDSAIYDDEGDCTVHYHVTFTYDMNMSFADAFHHDVKSVTLYLFDSKGELVTSKTDAGPQLASPGYYMDVEVLPGKYDMLVWAEGESPADNPTAFKIADIGQAGQMAALGATLPLQGEAGEVGAASGLYSDRDIRPLFHGMMREVDFSDTYGYVNLGPVNLTKDTNVMQILLQNTDGTPMEEGDFSFYITADNSALNYLNEVVSDTQFGYRPWSLTMTSASFDEPDPDASAAPSKASKAQTSKAQTEANGVLAEITTGRMDTSRRQKLVVRRNSDGTDIIRINLLQYLLMVKGEYNRAMTDQDYLDRKDSYTMMFFVDADRNWYIAGGVYINGWRIVPPQDVDL